MRCGECWSPGRLTGPRSGEIWSPGRLPESEHAVAWYVLARFESSQSDGVVPVAAPRIPVIPINTNNTKELPFPISLNVVIISILWKRDTWRVLHCVTGFVDSKPAAMSLWVIRLRVDKEIIHSLQEFTEFPALD